MDSVNLAALAAANLRQIPNRQQSNPKSLIDSITALEERFRGYPSDSPKRIRQLLRWLASSDDDVAGSLRDLQSLSSTGFETVFEGGARAVKLARDEIRCWSRHVYRGGLKQLCDNQVRELFITGASSVEWVPQSNRRGIAKAVVVEGETIKIRRGEEGLEYIQSGASLSKDITLHNTTYQYYPFDTDGSSPQGIPIPISAISSLDRKSRLIEGEDRIIKALSTLALIFAGVPDPTAQELGLTSSIHPEYAARRAEYYRQVADLISSGSANGLYVHPDGIKMTSNSLNQDVGGADAISQNNQKRVWNGVGSLPFMRGDMSANYALAKVVYPTLLALAANVQAVLRAQIEYGINLHLRLAGIPASAHIIFAAPSNPFRLDDAEAKLKEAQTLEVYKALFGDEYPEKIKPQLGGLA